MRKTGHSASKVQPLKVGWLVALLVLAGCASGTGATAHRSGPVFFPEAEVRQHAGVVDRRPGDQVMFGAAWVKNPSTETATLIRATLLGEVREEQASVVEVRVIDIGPDSKTEILGASPWPAVEFDPWWESGTPVDGYQLRPGSEAELAFLIKVHKLGNWKWSQVQLEYELSGQHYLAETNFGFQTCYADVSASGECLDPQ